MGQDQVTKAELIADLQRVSGLGSVTRDFYRANGKFSESAWHSYFGTFTEFVAAAGITKAVEPEQNEIVGNSWTITLPKTRIHTLDELLEYCKVDLSVWEVERFVVNKWEMGFVGTNGPDAIPLYQVKATLKKKQDVIAVRKEIDSLKAQAKQSAKTPKAICRPWRDSGNVLEINIPDPHFGKLAWPTETGFEPYDVDIAEVVYNRALETLLDRTKGHKFDEIVYVVGNDLLNADNMEGTTTKGTIVTTDIRYHKTFSRVRKTIVNAIERLRQIAPVRVIMVYGNHDQLASWHLGDSLECYFHNYTDVVIENTPKYRKYYQFGNVMLMFTHGDKAKRQDYPLLMATEQPEMFGATKYREAHTGHTHMTKLDEQHGVRVRVLPALCPPDDWHSENGFVGNLRNAEGYIWNKEQGLIGVVFHCDDAFPTVTTKRIIELKDVN